MSSKLSDSVLASAAHELLSPLTAIRGYTETLMKSGKENLSEKQKEYVSVVLGNCDRLQDFIEDMLELTRIDSRTFESFPQWTAPSPLLEDWWKKETRASPPFPAGLKVEENLPPIWADENRLRQVLHRLYRHGLEHVPAEGRLEVEVRKEGKNVVFRFAEAGAKTESSDLQEIFKRFSPSPMKKTSRGRRQGSLALAFCREASETFGAELEASRTEEAVVFSLTCTAQER